MIASSQTRQGSKKMTPKSKDTQHKQGLESTKLQKTDLSQIMEDPLFDALSKQKEILLQTFENRYSLTEIPQDIRGNLEKLQKIFMKLDDATMNQIIVSKHLITLDDHIPIDFTEYNSEGLMVSIRNDQKLSWLKSLRYNSVDNLLFRTSS